MIRTIIVEDDIEMLNGLLHIIAWEEYGYVIVGKAENGIEALRIIEETIPDLIITDITMPKMNGLDLIRAAKELNYSIKSIIISCNEDFHFAREAIRLEADDYILKHTLTKESLINTLEQFRSKFDEMRRQQVSFDNAMHNLKVNKYILLEQFFSEMSQGTITQETEILHQANKMNLRLPKKGMRLISLYLDNMEGMISNYAIKEYPLLKFALLNIMEETIGNKEEIILFPYRSDSFGMLYDDTCVSMNAMLQLTKKIITNISVFLHIPFSACFSHIFYSISDVGDALTKNEALRSEYFYIGSGRIIIKQPPSIKPPIDLYPKYGADFRYLLSLQNSLLLKNYIEKMFSSIEFEKYNSSSVKQLLLRLEIDMKLYLEKYQINLSILPLKGDTLEHLKKTFHENIDNIFIHISEPENKSNRKEIKQVLSYINTHIGEDINCDSMANYINMNSNYFSRLFKSEMGISFSEYLLNKRIDVATDLLKNTDSPIQEVTRIVGFESTSYFHRAYKKVTGITPGDARNNR